MTQSVFESRGFPFDSLHNDRIRVSSITYEKAPEKRIHNNEERIRLLLTYHPYECLRLQQYFELYL